MKKRFIMSLLFLGGMLLVAQALHAQLHTGKYAMQLHINKSGDVVDDLGTRLGYISKEDIVYNNQGQKLGFIKNGKVFDAEGNSMGRVKGSRYYNNDGVFVLRTKTIGDKCEILDPEGHKRGTVHRNYKLHACVTHCFFKEQQLRE